MKNLFLPIVVSLLVAFGTVHLLRPVNQTGTAPELASARILRTKTLRCGYFVYEPALIIDPNTKQKSGIFYELTEEMARRLGLKVDWTEEVGYGEITQGFDTGRYDLFCNVVFPTPERSANASFTLPLYYNLMGVFVRADDHRFDQDFMKLNDPAITVAVKDGDITASIATSVFPKAKRDAIPQMALTEQQLMDVSMGKADATFNGPELMQRFNATAAKKVRNITPNQPLKYFPSTYIMPKSDFALKTMLDTTLGDMLADGFVARTVAKYQTNPPSFIMPSLPFSAGK